jgi:hemolysin III
MSSLVVTGVKYPKRQMQPGRYEVAAADGQSTYHKPSLRGVLHQWAAVYALGSGTALVSLAPSTHARIAAAIYAASLVLLLTISAVYHRFQWNPGARTWLRRADHASIFLLIGGSYTPIAMLALGGDTGRHLLIAIWCGVALGVLVSMLWPGAPKWVSAALAIAVGWTMVPYLGAVGRALDTAEIWLIALGGVAYTVGAVVYASKRPNPWPRSFGYHEIFHALTLVGAGLHFVAMALIVRDAV